MFEQKYYLVDDCTTRRGASWNTVMLATNSMDAVKEMWREWDALTKHDQNERDEFYCVSDDGKEFYFIKRMNAHSTTLCERPEEVI